MTRLLFVFLFCMACVGADPAHAFWHGMASIPSCPNGIIYPYDGCQTPGGTYQDTTMLADYVRDANGNPATINHIGPYNKAGIDFLVGPLGTPSMDPSTQSVIGTATISGNTLTFVSISNGGTPQQGMTVWDAPSGGHAYYSDQPTISAPCTGSSPTYTCTLSKSETGHGGFTVYASFQPGCVTTTQPTASADGVVTCDFRNSASGFTATFASPVFGPINGHMATQLTENAGTSGHIILTNPKIVQDTDGVNMISSGISGINISLEVDNPECDGGNDGVAVGAPQSSFPFPSQSTCINWQSPGSLGNANNITITNPWIHDWAGNAVALQLGYTAILVQSPVFFKVGMNCGTGAGTNGQHGAPIEFSTTLTGSVNYGVTINNPTEIYPYGFRYGATTAGLAILGGIASAQKIPITIQGGTIITNASNFTTGGPHSTMSEVVDPFRIGEVTNLVVKHLYVNDVGAGGCISVGADLQVGSAATGSETAGSGVSTVTFSGFSGQVPLPFPGQTLIQGNPSSAVTFEASLSDNGNGTSTLTIVGTPPSTLTSGTQVVALRMADPEASPTLIVSGSGSSYVVSNGTGSGETRAQQLFVVAQVIQPFGTGGTTASGGTSVSNYNGTYQVGGQATVSPANSNWAAYSPRIDNYATIDTDVSDNWDMLTLGTGAAWSVDGPNLARGACPNTSSN